ncbi:MAG: hypothetical protein AAGA08_03310 [Pseudomonadota bacterium]
MTRDLERKVAALQPDVVVASAGEVRFDIGSKIIMDAHEMIALAKLAAVKIVANHIGAISHCPATRTDVLNAVSGADLDGRIFDPDNGQTMTFN